jgi:hypothetical protein
MLTPRGARRVPERTAMIYQNKARGADRAITDAIYAKAHGYQHQGDHGSAKVLVRCSQARESFAGNKESPRAMPMAAWRCARCLAR